MTDHRRRSADQDDYLPPPSQPNPRIIDAKMPLTWLLSSAGSIIFASGLTLWSVAGMSNKVDQLIVSNANLEKRVNDRDVRIDGIRDSVFELRRSVDTLSLKYDEVQREVARNGRGK